ncbi:hypothetical protein [Brachybacterium sp. GPGPB12]|uniref:hypothetical protein n=1 Tax=Brachybacterium sp. GPGPB12 TaxID=3023517 RepID=UPI003134246F
MDTFCGCDTETLDDLAERVREGAPRLIQLIEPLREAAESVDWTGPDADAHRHRTATMADHGLAAGADLRAKALELRRHAWEQERASELDPGAAVRAELPGDRGGKEIFEEPGRWIGGPMAPADPRDPAPGLRGLPTTPGGWGPWIGGPMAPADPTSPLPSLPTPPGGWGPWSGGPFMPSPPPPAVSGPRPRVSSSRWIRGSSPRRAGTASSPSAPSRSPVTSRPRSGRTRSSGTSTIASTRRPAAPSSSPWPASREFPIP